MRSPDLYLSFNEIMFYFTRAAVGVGTPFGLAEDFGRAAMWIAASGLDPACFAKSAIKELESGNSSLKANLKEGKKVILFSADDSKKLSSIQAGSALCDLISAQTEIPNNFQCIIAEKVDSPFIVCAALGASNCKGWEISWIDKDLSPNSVLICEDGGWMSSWKEDTLPELNYAVDLNITFVKKCKNYYEKWEGKTFYSGDNKKKLLETGIPVYDSWSVILSFFKRCLVPSTEKSRKKGAGAGLLETD